MYTTHRRHTTQVPPTTHQATTIQSSSQTVSHLTQILNQHQYTQFKYTHATTQITKRNNRTHVNTARREIPPHLQKQYHTSTTIKKNTPKIQNHENRENSKPTIFCPIRKSLRPQTSLHWLIIPWKNRTPGKRQQIRFHVSTYVTPLTHTCDTRHLPHNLDQISDVKRLLTRDPTVNTLKTVTPDTTAKLPKPNHINTTGRSTSHNTKTKMARTSPRRSRSIPRHQHNDLKFLQVKILRKLNTVQHFIICNNAPISTVSMATYRQQ